mmetsp:Transcript_38077/g.92629  ORF Transcript_38077/g.92629 Transcript_38077/m.92629 type:complete len:313 (+) Transcript_38077:408-1346(+)
MTSQESDNNGNDLPAAAATIESIFSSPVASGHMVSLPSATLIQGVGLEGDRYSTKTGTYSCLKASIYNDDDGDGDDEDGSPPKPEPGRQLTLISGDGVRQVLQELSDQKKKKQNEDTTESEEEDLTESWTTKSIGDFRRNIVLAGINASELLSTVGSVLEFSRSLSSPSLSDDQQQQQQRPRLLVHRNCVPCKYNERKNRIPGLMEALWDSGGVSCEILVGGTIHVGDRLIIVADKEEQQRQYRIDPGKQSSGFFVRPSKRTAAMVKDGLEGSKKAYTKLIKSDPGGVERAEASYNSVGLNFWPRSVVSKTT